MSSSRAQWLSSVRVRAVGLDCGLQVAETVKQIQILTLSIDVFEKNEKKSQLVRRLLTAIPQLTLSFS